MVKKVTDLVTTRTGLCSVRNGSRLCILENLKEWIGDRKKVGITGAFGVPGKNDNGRRVK